MLCKHEVVGSSPTISTLYLDDIAQLVEQWNHDPKVVSSNLTVIILYLLPECGVDGSAPVLGTGGHVFKSHHSDLK